MTARALAVAVVAIVATAACGARTDDGGYCNLGALAYCRANGCPVYGPIPGEWPSWSAASGAFAAQVTGIADCDNTTSLGRLNAVEARGPYGTIDLFYDKGGDLIGVVVSSDKTEVFGTCDLTQIDCLRLGATCP